MSFTEEQWRSRQENWRESSQREIDRLQAIIDGQAKRLAELDALLAQATTWRLWAEKRITELELVNSGIPALRERIHELQKLWAEDERLGAEREAELTARVEGLTSKNLELATELAAVEARNQDLTKPARGGHS